MSTALPVTEPGLFFLRAGLLVVEQYCCTVAVGAVRDKIYTTYMTYSNRCVPSQLCHCRPMAVLTGDSEIQQTPYVQVQVLNLVRVYANTVI
jgi:hypothetical protein